MKDPVCIVIPAWNEGNTIGKTMQAIKRGAATSPIISDIELIVVDDGSTDDTMFQAASLADQIISFPENRGKGAALEAGWKKSAAPIILFLDADLGETAVHFPLLVHPIIAAEADMTIAKLPPALTRGGFGLVKRLACYGIAACSGFQATAPLSGQRALRKDVLTALPPFGSGFGIEVGLTIDAVRLGYRVSEVEVPFRHRETARNFAGFMHRGKQFVAVGRTLIAKWEMNKT